MIIFLRMVLVVGFFSLALVHAGPLHDAIRGGNINEIEALIRGGANLGEFNEDGCSPLYYAVLSGRIEIVELLIRGVLKMRGDMLHMFMHRELRGENLKLLRSVRSQLEILNVNARDVLGQTVLHKAATLHAVEIFSLLVDIGADATVRDLQGRTPLHWVFINITELSQLISFEHIMIRIRTEAFGSANDGVLEEEIMEREARCRALVLLLEAHGVIDDETINLHELMRRNAHSRDGEQELLLEMIRRLLLSRVNVDEPDNEGQSALHYAAKFNATLDTVQMLLAANANVNLRDREGRIPLHWFFTNDLEMVRALVAAGGDLNSRDNRGREALSWELGEYFYDIDDGSDEAELSEDIRRQDVVAEVVVDDNEEAGFVNEEPSEAEFLAYLVTLYEGAGPSDPDGIVDAPGLRLYNFSGVYPNEGDGVDQNVLQVLVDDLLRREEDDDAGYGIERDEKRRRLE